MAEQKEKMKSRISGRAQADRLRRLIALEHLDRKEEELLYGKED